MVLGSSLVLARGGPHLLFSSDTHMRRVLPSFSSRVKQIVKRTVRSVPTKSYIPASAASQYTGARWCATSGARGRSDHSAPATSCTMRRDAEKPYACRGDPTFSQLFDHCHTTTSRIAGDFSCDWEHWPCSDFFQVPGGIWTYISESELILNRIYKLPKPIVPLAFHEGNDAHLLFEAGLEYYQYNGETGYLWHYERERFASRDDFLACFLDPVKGKRQMIPQPEDYEAIEDAVQDEEDRAEAAEAARQRRTSIVDFSHHHVRGVSISPQAVVTLRSLRQRITTPYPYSPPSLPRPQLGHGAITVPENHGAFPGCAFCTRRSSRGSASASASISSGFSTTSRFAIDGKNRRRLICTTLSVPFSLSPASPSLPDLGIFATRGSLSGLPLTLSFRPPGPHLGSQQNKSVIYNATTRLCQSEQK
ncbi:hypothetical protein C8R47DRAFT_1076677 [Mycena vitilis]|nr:hypothetical protein C8R47DRAFT_1076677 [Mycena vitilis]